MSNIEYLSKNKIITLESSLGLYYLIMFRPLSLECWGSGEKFKAKSYEQRAFCGLCTLRLSDKLKTVLEYIRRPLTLSSKKKMTYK